MADLARHFLDEYVPDHLKPGTAALYRKIIEKRILPRLGKRRVTDIGRAARRRPASRHALGTRPCQPGPSASFPGC